MNFCSIDKLAIKHSAKFKQPTNFKFPEGIHVYKTIFCKHKNTYCTVAVKVAGHLDECTNEQIKSVLKGDWLDSEVCYI